MTMTLPNSSASLPEGVEMPLTPDEIANKTFPSVLRGYAKWEVDEFLKDVALDYQRALGLAEWAMQRSSLLLPDAMHEEETWTVNAESSYVAESGYAPETAYAVPAASSPDLPPPATVEADLSGQPLVQFEKLGEHIRYLAVLVNNLNQRIDTLETQRTGSLPLQVSSEPLSVSNGHPSAHQITGNSHPTPIETVNPSPSEWWPTESPLWVVNKTR